MEQRTTAAALTKSARYKALKRDMLDSLEARGLIGRQYTERVEEYMSLWCWLQMLNEDIALQGVSVEYVHGKDQRGTTDNKSLGIATRVLAQMNSLWKALGFQEQAQNSKMAQGGVDDDL